MVVRPGEIDRRAGVTYGQPASAPTPAAPRTTPPTAPLTGLDLAIAQGLPSYAIPSAQEFFSRTETTPTPVSPVPRPAAPSGPSGPSWQEMLEAQRRQAEAMRQRLEAEYRSRKADLRAEFEFAETEQERAQLAFLMNSLDQALTAGQQAISAGYNAARSQVGQLSRASQQAAATETAAVQGLFGQAQERLGGRIEELATQVGPGAGLMGDALSGSQDFYNLLATDAAREAALGERLSGVVARDIAAGQERMFLQEAAQQADLGRSGMQTRASLTAQQQAAVAQRIAEDRRSFVSALQRLQSDISARGGQLDLSGLGTYTEAARISASEAEQARRLAAEAARQRDAFAFAREQDALEQERRLARGETPEFERDMLDFARRLQEFRSLPPELQSPGAWSDIMGRPVPESWLGTTTPVPTPSPTPAPEVTGPTAPTLPSAPTPRVIPESEFGPGYTYTPWQPRPPRYDFPVGPPIG